MGIIVVGREGGHIREHAAPQFPCRLLGSYGCRAATSLSSDLCNAHNCEHGIYILSLACADNCQSQPRHNCEAAHRGLCCSCMRGVSRPTSVRQLLIAHVGRRHTVTKYGTLPLECAASRARRSGPNPSSPTIILVPNFPIHEPGQSLELYNVSTQCI